MENKIYVDRVEEGTKMEITELEEGGYIVEETRIYKQDLMDLKNRVVNLEMEEDSLKHQNQRLKDRYKEIKEEKSRLEKLIKEQEAKEEDLFEF